MVDHIYGRKNFLSANERPNFFLKELKLYIEYLKKLIAESGTQISEKQIKYYQTFQSNLSNGIEYYKNLYLDYKEKYEHFKSDFLHELELLRSELSKVIFEKELETEDSFMEHHR